MQNHSNRALGWLTIGLVAAATTAPATQAASASPDDRGYSRTIRPRRGRSASAPTTEPTPAAPRRPPR